MSAKILLDTCAYSELFRGDEKVLDALADAKRVYIPVTVLGELFSGFRNGKQESKNRSELREFLSQPSVRVLQTSVETADIYSSVVEGLRQIGKRIPTNDIWIAAHALDVGAVLITYDRHFDTITGLRKWNP